MSSKPVLLPTLMKEKVWGSKHLLPWYPDAGVKIGEVWFTCEEPLPILVKFLFTTEALSVQVHPSDEFAARYENNSPGKTEMWHVLRAEKGARIALGFKETIAKERLRESALTGEIEELLNWIEVSPGDTYFTPAGTVHAIGAGIVLCEIQQQSDVTYRLYDYGRPRPLQLEKAIQVSNREAYLGAIDPVDLGNGRQLLAECPYFRTEAMHVRAAQEYAPDADRLHLLIVLSGTGELAGMPYARGQCWLVPAGGEGFAIAPRGETEMLRTWVP